MDTYGYDDSRMENTQTKTFFCGSCQKEMIELSRNESICPGCGKNGWDIIYQCPRCKGKTTSFRQDLTGPPFCYCNNP